MSSQNNGSQSWDSFLMNPSNLIEIPPVNYFKHAIFSEEWVEFQTNMIGRYIELPNVFVNGCHREKVNWVGKIRLFAGYKALVEYVSFGMEPEHLVWISALSTIPKTIGYSTDNHILLHPTIDVAEAYPNFIGALGNELKHQKTISEDYAANIKKRILKVQEKYPMKSVVEALDRTNIHALRRAYVTGYIGDRIHVTYTHETEPNDEGFVFSIYSDAVHPVGWAKEVGQPIYEPQIENHENIIEEKPLSITNILPPLQVEIKLEIGNVLEARHPLYPCLICEGTVEKVYKHGYFQVGFRTNKEEIKDPVFYCFHVTSPYIFQRGFCSKNKIKLTKSLEKNSEAIPVPLDLLPERPKHSFKTGMKLECVDINDPSYIGPATILKVVDHLLFLYFNGWSPIEKGSQIWMSSDSPDIYPIGYAELTGCTLSGTVPNNLS